MDLQGYFTLKWAVMAHFCDQEPSAGIPSFPKDDPPPSSDQDNIPDIVCGICIQSIDEKTLPKDKKFGILPNCKHCFCEPCIVTWRQMEEYSRDVVK